MTRAYRRWVRPQPDFLDSGSYWDDRYRLGGNSGDGSYGKLAEFKAGVVNELVAAHTIQSVLELGCGDGNQLSLARYPNAVGLDVSSQAIESCRKRFAGDETKSFSLMSDYAGGPVECTLSLDVIYHLVEDEVFDDYMKKLFGLAERFVVVYSSNTEEQVSDVVKHVRHRKFTDWIDAAVPDFDLIETIPNNFPPLPGKKEGSFADFFIYEKRPSPAP